MTNRAWEAASRPRAATVPVRVLAACLLFALPLSPPHTALAHDHGGSRQARFRAAVQLHGQGRTLEARRAFATILADYDTPANRADAAYGPLLAGCLYYLGETHFHEEEFDDAEARYGQVLASFRDYRPESRFRLGLAKFYREDYAAAIREFEGLVAESPDAEPALRALYYLGICHERLGEKDASAARFRRLAERHPEHAWASDARKRSRR